MLALKGENSCKYKHGEIHLELEQTCFSDSLTVTWGWNRFQNHCPTGPHIVSSCLTSINTLAHTLRHEQTHPAQLSAEGPAREERPSQPGQLYGQAEISRCFPSSKLLVSVVIDRQSDSQFFLSHTDIGYAKHTKAQWLTQRWTNTKGVIIFRQQDTIPLDGCHWSLIHLCFD